MKNYFFFLLMFTGALAHAQIKQGTILYDRKIDVHRRMQDEQMKAMVPQFRTDKHVLLFNDSVSVYKTVTEDEAPDPFNNGNGNIQIRVDGPGDNGILHKNFITQKLLEQTELGDKDYVIVDTIHAQPWKLADETKTILNHVCKKATLKTERGNDVIAWYAEDILNPAGPENYSGLPGVILSVDINNGEILFTATEIKEEVNVKEFKEPEKGKYITRANFEKKMDELFGPPTPDGRRVVRFNN
jgi:GLPGLI family protein